MPIRVRQSCWIAFALAGLLTAVESASAFVRTRPRGRDLPARWQRPQIELVVRTHDVPAGWTRAQLLATLRSTAARWSTPAVRCTALRIAVRDGDDQAPGALRDRVSSVSVYAHRFCRGGVERRGGCYDPRMAALTTTQFGDTAGREIMIDEADIELNAADFRFAPVGRTAMAGELDLEAVLLHELGHAIGLADNCRAGGSSTHTDHLGRPLPACRQAPPAVLRSVMFPAAQVERGHATARQRRTLTDDDIAGACALYPMTGAVR